MTGLRSQLFLLVGLCVTATSDAATPLRDGDIIFHTSRSAQSAAIQRATQMDPANNHLRAHAEQIQRECR